MSQKLTDYLARLKAATTIEQLNGVYVVARDDKDFTYDDFRVFDAEYRKRYSQMPAGGSPEPGRSKPWGWVLPVAIVVGGLLFLSRQKIGGWVKRRRNPGAAWHEREAESYRKQMQSYPKGSETWNLLKSHELGSRRNAEASRNLGILNPRRRRNAAKKRYQRLSWRRVKCQRCGQKVMQLFPVGSSKRGTLCYTCYTRP